MPSKPKTKMPAGEHGFSQADWDAVSDNPEWTEEDFKRAVPFTGTLDELGKTLARLRGRPKAAVTKKQVTLRLSPEVIEHFKADGPGWQTRIDETLRRAAGLK